MLQVVYGSREDRVFCLCAGSFFGIKSTWNEKVLDSISFFVYKM